jgi:hypothetical protein
MSEHTVLVKKEGNPRSQRWAFSLAKQLIMDQAFDRQVIRRTTHGNGTETTVTYYYLPGVRWQITETTAI